MCKHFCYFVIPLLRCSLPYPAPTTALTCVLRCFPCEPTWAGSPFLHRPPTPPMVRMTRSKTFQAYLPSCHRTYSCIHCRAHLANHDELISKVSVEKGDKMSPSGRMYNTFTDIQHQPNCVNLLCNFIIASK